MIKIKRIIIIVVLVILVSCGPTEKVQVSTEIVKTTEKEKKLEITNTKRTDKEITGKIKNTLNCNLSYIEVQIQYKKDGEIVSNDMTNLVNFKAGDVWNFRFNTESIIYDKYTLILSNYEKSVV